MAYFKNQSELNSFLADINSFSLRTLAPIARKADRNSKLPSKEIISLFKEKGIWNCGRPEKWGGMGLSFSEYWRVIAEIALTGRAITMLFHGRNTGNWRMLEAFGNEEQKQRYLGEIMLNFCLTERNAGSGMDIKTYGKQKNNMWYLNGEKYLASYADVVDAFGIIAWSNLEKKEVSIFIAQKDATGLSYKSMGNSMGARGSIHGIITLKNAEVPAKDVIYIGSMQNILDFLDISRASIAAQSLGICRRCYLLAVEYAKKRETFGRPISSRQAVRSMIAEMAIYLYALENCIVDTARKIDTGLGIRREAASCKRLAIETIRRVTDNAFLIHGGRGYWNEFPIEMLYRDARAMWFEEGTQHIQEMVISREVVSNPQWW